MLLRLPTSCGAFLRHHGGLHEVMFMFNRPQSTSTLAPPWFCSNAVDFLAVLSTIILVYDGVCPLSDDQQNPTVTAVGVLLSYAMTVPAAM